MLILRKSEAFFLDRDNSVFQVDGLRFPMRKDPQRHIENTLLDGVRLVKSSLPICKCAVLHLHILVLSNFHLIRILL